MPQLRVIVRDGFGNEAVRTVVLEVAAAHGPPAPAVGPARRVRLGQILLEAGVINRAQLDVALAEQERTGERLGAVLRRMGLGSQEAIAEALAQQLRIPYIRIETSALDEALLLQVPEPVARRHQVIPIRVRENRLVLGMVDPVDLLAADDVSRLTRMIVEPAVITLDDFQRAIGQYPTAAGTMGEIIEQITVPTHADEDEPLDHLQAVAQDAPVVRLVNLIIVQAVREGASDIHIEPQERRVRVRYRVDGNLYTMMTPPAHVHAALVSRLKIMANMNIAERRVPQDGRVDLKIENQDVRLRVSTVPTTYGETAVVRILARSNAVVAIDRLGLRPDDARRFESIVTRPHGIVLFTGPTGSGKTTSLYAVLSRLNRTEVNIVTIEDPVEYQLPGINQVQVNPKAGLTFASGLRSFLRQDPDIIMVGEIRDEETARIAIHAALTGHLVLSTLHTNDAPSAVVRLVDMGIEPFLVSSSVIGVVAQRLVRVLCRTCREAYIPEPGTVERLGLAPAAGEAPPTFYRAGGCDLCNRSGYHGRTGLFEVMAVEDHVRELIARHAPASALREAAIASGMRTLQDDGVAKVLDGTTSLEELRRVVFLRDVSPAASADRLVRALAGGPAD
ncbi:MAG: ATPase, T2SS/T4P/T4SS family [Armatimonadota bacterium]|nr:ATPase, T2SS/T4P/T4SS family [Armatimonadota bacterium]